MINGNVLIDIANAVNLREGSEGVRSFLREVYLNEGISTKACSRNIRLPLPITAALKKEAIKRQLLNDVNTMRLTDNGRTFCELELKLNKQSKLLCPRCNGLRYLIPEEFNVIKEKLGIYLSFRPQVDVTIDQAFGNINTALRRVSLLFEKGLEGQKILFFGDDDLVSVALLLAIKYLKPNLKPDITVLDIDERLLDYIDNIATELEMEIDLIHYDAKQALPNNLLGSYEVMFTDPPYTTSGAKLFLTRVKQLLKPEVNLPVFFSYGPKAPQEMLQVQQVLTELGFTIEEVMPNFNEYEGAAILGNVGQMLVLKNASKLVPSLGCFTQAIYTKEVK